MSSPASNHLPQNGYGQCLSSTDSGRCQSWWRAQRENYVLEARGPDIKNNPRQMKKIKRWAPTDLITERSGANRELMDSRDDVDGQSPELEASAPARSLFSIHSTPIRKIDSKDNKRCQTPSRGTGRLVTHSPLRVHSGMPIQSAV